MICEKFPEVDPYFNQAVDLTLTKHEDSQEIQLAVIAPFYLQCNELFTDNATTLFALLRISRLDILHNGIFVGILIDLIHHLPNLISLRVWSLSLVKSQWMSDEEASTLGLLLNNNTITQVSIQCLNDLAQIQFLIDLCPSMQYLEIECSNDINFISLIRFILMSHVKCIPYLYLVCLCTPQVNEKMIQDIHEMIQLEKLRFGYVIKHTNNKIYLQWK